MEMSQNLRSGVGYKRLTISGESEDEDSRIMDETGVEGNTSFAAPRVPEGHQNGNKDNDKEKSTSFAWVLSFFAAIGGFLFGYDTGVVSGAMLLLTERFKLTSLWQEIIVSIAIATAFIGAIFGGFFNNRFGRKSTVVLASCLFTVGAVILGAAQNIAMLVIGRAVLGLGIGLASMTVPMYIAECSPSHMRGKMVTINNLFITGGQFIASIIDGAFSYTTDGWRYMLGLAGIPSLIQIAGFILLPESPRWLVDKNKHKEARDVLISIRGTQDVDTELNEIKRVCDIEKESEVDSGNKMTALRMLRNPPVRRALIVGCSLQLFQQLSGINTVMYYSATIIKMGGISDNHQAIWLAALTASINCVFTIVGIVAVDRFGRKPLIITSLIGVTLSLVVLAVGFQLAALYSPAISQFNPSIDNTTCSMYKYCEKCIEDTDCGYCFTKLKNNTYDGSCLATSSTDNSHSLHGQCNNTDVSGGVVWAYEYCPTSYSWIIIVGLVFYLMFFAPGMGPMPWTYNSEIYPLWARSTGNSLSAATNWISNLIVSMTFLTLTETLTKYGTYWLFVGICALALIWFIYVLPETKGLQLEEIETLFDKPWSQCCGQTSQQSNSYDVPR